MASTAEDTSELINGGRYPRTAEYIRALPMGLDSFPSCTSRRDAVASVLVAFPQLLELDEIPLSLRTTLRDSSPTMPEVMAQSLLLLARDTVLKTDTSFEKYIYQSSAELFDRPMYRVLMKLVSPNLVMMGAGRRWNTWHLGTNLAARKTGNAGNRVQAEATLTYPEGLFGPLSLQLFGFSFRAALDASRGRGVRVQVGAQSEGRCLYDISWDA